MDANTQQFIAKLHEARELIERGWTQGAYSEVKGGHISYCLVGAGK